jgi:WD40 repeat protein
VDELARDKREKPLYLQKRAKNIALLVVLLVLIYPRIIYSNGYIHPQIIDSFLELESKTNDKTELARISSQSSLNPKIIFKEGDLRAELLYQKDQWEWNEDPYDISFSPDGLILASAHSDRIRLWNASDGRHIRSLESNAEEISYISFTCLSFSPNGQLLAAGYRLAIPGVNKYIYVAKYMFSLWQISSGDCIRTLSYHNNTIENIAFSPNGLMLATGSHDGSIALWDVDTGYLLRTLPKYRPVISLAFHPEGKILGISYNYGVFKFWRTNDGSLLRTKERNSIPIADIAFSPNGELFASSSGEKGVELWNLSDFSLTQSFYDDGTGVFSLAFSYDDEFLAYGCGTRTKLVSLENYSITLDFARQASPTMNLDFGPDGSTLVLQTSKKIEVWNIFYISLSDLDNDSIPDEWENTHGLNSNYFEDKFGDPDQDGLMNILEFKFGTLPNLYDTDFDSIPDGYEFFNHLNGSFIDSENDTDGDGLPNSYEFQNDLLARINDSIGDKDNDELTNLQEFQLGLRANNNDSDSDTMPDGWEIRNDLDPTIDDASDDSDGDGLTNLEEYQLGTAANRIDTDFDGVNDGLDPDPLNLGSHENNFDALFSVLQELSPRLMIGLVILVLLVLTIRQIKSRK